MITEEQLAEWGRTYQPAVVHLLIAEVRRLRGGAAAYATVCSAIGIEYAPDTGPTYPGPVEAVVAAIKEMTRERDALRAVVEAALGALGKIAELGDWCEYCEPTERKNATHVDRNLNGVPFFYCDECAEAQRQQLKKEASKGCGPLGVMEPHEQDDAVAIALAALAKLDEVKPNG